MPSIIECISVEAVARMVNPFFTEQTDCDKVRIDFHVDLSTYGREGITGFHSAYTVIVGKSKFLKNGGFTEAEYDMVDKVLDEAPFVSVQEAK